MKTIIIGVAFIVTMMAISAILINRAYYKGQEEKICACELQHICTQYSVLPNDPSQEGVIIFECRINTK